MFSKNILKILAISIVAMTGTFLIFGQACGPRFEPATSLSSTLGDSCPPEAANVIDKTYEILPTRRTVSIAYGKQMLDSMVSCTGIGKPSVRTKDEWNRRNQSLSEYGGMADVSGAMMMAIAGVAAEVCEDLVTREIAMAPTERGIFGGTNLAGTSLSLSEMNSTADLLGLACWQRMPTNDERVAITNSVGALNLNSRMGALSLCTAMLSSLAAVEQ
jgi:hypothetical protein